MEKLKWLWVLMGLGSKFVGWAAKSFSDSKLDIREGGEALKIGLTEFGIPTSVNIPVNDTVKTVLAVFVEVGKQAQIAIDDGNVNIDEGVTAVEQGLIAGGIPTYITLGGDD